MASYQIHEIKGYIQTIYLVEQGPHLLILDGCCRCDVDVVQTFIEEDLKRNFSNLQLVISTHAHPDHSGGLKYFKEKGIPIAGPEKLSEWYGGLSGFLTYGVDILLTYLVAINKKRGIRNIIFPRNVKLDYVLKDGDSIPGFDEWQVLETPGHTNCDLTIYHKETQVAYIADNFVVSTQKVFRPYPIYSPERYKESLKRYMSLRIEEFLLAHYGRQKISSAEIEKLISSTPIKPRIHMNTLPGILVKLFKSLLGKI